MQVDTFSDTILVGSIFNRGVCNLFSAEMQKLFDNEQKESVIIMLKKKMSVEDIMEILKVTREYVLQVAQENNL